MRLKDHIWTAHQEIVLLIVLSLATVPLFLFTRMAAALNRKVHIEIAYGAHEDGLTALNRGDIPAAIELFRRAATNVHDNPIYRLDLARALASQGNTGEAWLMLLQLRESAPENAGVNLDLARIAAESGQTPEAVRYYRNALYGLWPEADGDRRRREVRIELVHFFLEQGQKSAALSELLAFSIDMPDTAQDHVLAGQLFLTAEDASRALDQFMRSLRADRNNVDALKGAGEAAFELARYDDAIRYLESAIDRGEQSAKTEDLLEIAQLVRRLDVLAPRTSLAERRSRLVRGFTHAEARLRMCMETLNGEQRPTVILRTLDAEAMQFEPQLTAASIRSNPDLLQVGLNLLYRVQTEVDGICGNPTRFDQALVLMARMHGVQDEQSSR